jgi:hypothetical protein
MRALRLFLLLLCVASALRAATTGGYVGGMDGIVVSWHATDEPSNSRWFVKFKTTGAVIAYWRVRSQINDSGVMTPYDFSGVIDPGQNNSTSTGYCLVPYSSLSATITINMQVPGGAYGSEQFWTLGPPVPAQKVLVSKFNSNTYPIKIKVYGQPSGTFLGEYTLQPNTGVSAYVGLPTGDTSATVTVTPMGVEKSGEVWSDNPLGQGPEVADPLPLLPQPNDAPPTPPPAGPTNPNNTPLPPGLPGSNQQPSQIPDGQVKPTVWSPGTGQATTQGTALDQNTFKEGIGKLETAIGKIGTGTSTETVPGVTVDNLPSETEAESAADADAVVGILAKFPAAPVMPSVGVANSLTIPFHFMDIESAITFDFEEMQDASSLYRQIMTWLVGLMFWLACLRTARQSVSPV